MSSSVSSPLDVNKLIDRLVEEDDELRSISPAEGAQGRNGSDYRQMYDMFLHLVNDAAAIRGDPKAFRDANGTYNDKVINAYSKIMSLAIKGMSELNRMRNNDKMVSKILNEHAQDLSQNVSIELGLEIKAIVEAIDHGESSEDIAIRLKRLMYRRIPEVFLRVASETLTASRAEYGLLQ